MCVIRCGGVGLVKGMYFSQSKNALLLNLFVFHQIVETALSGKTEYEMFQRGTLS